MVSPSPQGVSSVITIIAELVSKPVEVKQHAPMLEPFLAGMARLLQALALIQILAELIMNHICNIPPLLFIDAT
jgi:hypothetical protein